MRGTALAAISNRTLHFSLPPFTAFCCCHSSSSPDMEGGAVAVAESGVQRQLRCACSSSSYLV